LRVLVSVVAHVSVCVENKHGITIGIPIHVVGDCDGDAFDSFESVIFYMLKFLCVFVFNAFLI
jgi:hypothetical protein